MIIAVDRGGCITTRQKHCIMTFFVCGVTYRLTSHMTSARGLDKIFTTRKYNKFCLLGKKNGDTENGWTFVRWKRTGKSSSRLSLTKNENTTESDSKNVQLSDLQTKTSELFSHDKDNRKTTTVADSASSDGNHGSPDSTVTRQTSETQTVTQREELGEFTTKVYLARVSFKKYLDLFSYFLQNCGLLFESERCRTCL